MRRGAATRLGAPTAPPPGVARLAPFVCPEPARWRRCRERPGALKPSKGNEAPGVKLLSCRPPRSGSTRPPPLTPSPGLLFLLLEPAPCAVSARAWRARSPPPFLPGIPWKVLCLPRSEEGAGGSSGEWLAWLPVSLTFLRADSSLPCNFLFRGKLRLQPTGKGRG